MARIDAAAIRVDRQWVTAADVVDAAIAHVRHALEGHAVARGRRRRSARWKSIRVSRRWPCRTCSKTRRSTRRRPRASSCTRASSTTGCTYRSPTTARASIPASSIICSSASTAAGRPAQASFGTGMGLSITRGLLAAAGGTGLGRERARRRRAILDRRCRARCASRHGGAVDDGRAHPHRRRRAEHHRHRGAAAARARLRRVLGDERPRRPRERGARQAGSHRARSRPARHRRRRGVPTDPGDHERADPGAVGARRRRRQGAGAGRRRRRLRDQAVRRRGTARAHPRVAAAGRDALAAERADRARRPGHRSRAVPRARATARRCG